MEPLQQKIEAQEAKLDAILKSVKKTELYFKIIIWATIIMFVLPLIGIMAIAPTILSTYSTLTGII